MTINYRVRKQIVDCFAQRESSQEIASMLNVSLDQIQDWRRRYKHGHEDWVFRDHQKFSIQERKEIELSPESETLSGDIFMSKKISAEIRHQVLLLLRQGARAQSIATQLRLTKSWVQQCQYRFDLGDLTWLDPTYRSLVTPELALRAVREYEICRNYAQAARVCNISRSDVYRYVQNMAKWGVPLLPRGRPSASTKLAMKTSSCAKIPVPVKKPKTLKSAERMLEEQRIVLESLLESMNKHLGGTEGSKKKISSLTMQLRQHIAAGYPLPDLADSPIPAGAPFIVVLETLANECRKIRNSWIESEFSKSITKDDTVSDE